MTLAHQLVITLAQFRQLSNTLSEAAGDIHAQALCKRECQSGAWHCVAIQIVYNSCVFSLHRNCQAVFQSCACHIPPTACVI